MKQRIAVSDIESLTPAQQENLRGIWMPERYDIVAARFCINAETDDYKWIEFAVGDIEVLRGGELLLQDMRLTDGYVKINEGETDLGGEDEAHVLQEPTAFRKSESLPLLSIGQMINLLHLLDKRLYHFYLLAGNDAFSCEIGDFNSELKPALLEKPDKNTELVDVLWTTVKTIL